MSSRSSSRSREPVRFLSTKELAEAARQIAENTTVPMAIAGGYAMQIYGSDRLTTDLDLVAARMPGKLPKLRPLTFGGYATRAPDGVPVDVIVRDDEFARLYRDALRVARRVRGAPIPVVPLGHLIAMKMLAARPKDDLDLDFILPRMTKSELAEARRTVVRHLGAYAGRELDDRIAEAVWRASRDPEDHRRRRYRGKA
jgi:hypothetical protein